MSSPDVPWKHRWLFIHFLQKSLLNIFDDRALKPWDTSKEGDPYVKAGTPTSIFAPELLPKPTGRFGALRFYYFNEDHPYKRTDTSVVDNHPYTK